MTKDILQKSFAVPADPRVKWLTYLVYLLITVMTLMTGYNSYAMGEMSSKYVTVDQYRCDTKLLRDEIAILRSDTRDIKILVERWLIP